MDDARLDELISGALSRRAGATIYLLPRSDGQYANHATDMVALLEEAGVAVDYVTDPMAAGVYAQKSADLVLPPLLILFGDAASIASAISGVIAMIRWLTTHSGRSRVSVEVITQLGADGSSRRRISIANATADEAERLLKQAAKVRPPR